MRGPNRLAAISGSPLGSTALTQTRSILYDKDGRATEDETAAIRGEVVELDAEGKVVATHPWKVDPISLDGDEGELATRPTEPSRGS